MSGNFNEDGSLKNLGTTAEELAEQFKQLENQFDAKIDKKLLNLKRTHIKGRCQIKSLIWQDHLKT